EKLNILLLPDMKRHDIADGHAMRIPRQPLNAIAAGQMAFLDHRDVKPRAAALQKHLQHIVASEANPELEARQARLGHDKLRRPDAKAIADADVRLQQ